MFRKGLHADKVPTKIVDILYRYLTLYKLYFNSGTLSTMDLTEQTNYKRSKYEMAFTENEYMKHLQD